MLRRVNKHRDGMRPLLGKAVKEAPVLFTVGFCFFEGPRWACVRTGVN